MNYAELRRILKTYYQPKKFKNICNNGFSGLYYKSFMIVIYTHNERMIVLPVERVVAD